MSTTLVKCENPSLKVTGGKKKDQSWVFLLKVEGDIHC